MVGIEDISLLEAHRKFTLVHLPDGKFLVRGSLKDCGRRLDSSAFFRASRGCIVNLSHAETITLSRRRKPHFHFKGRKRSRIVSKAIRSLP